MGQPAHGARAKRSNGNQQEAVHRIFLEKTCQTACRRFHFHGVGGPYEKGRCQNLIGIHGHGNRIGTNDLYTPGLTSQLLFGWRFMDDVLGYTGMFLGIAMAFPDLFRTAVFRLVF